MLGPLLRMCVFLFQVWVTNTSFYMQLKHHVLANFLPKEVIPVASGWLPHYSTNHSLLCNEAGCFSVSLVRDPWQKRVERLRLIVLAAPV